MNFSKNENFTDLIGWNGSEYKDFYSNTEEFTRWNIKNPKEWFVHYSNLLDFVVSMVESVLFQ